jgi:hypothetical protein
LFSQNILIGCLPQRRLASCGNPTKEAGRLWESSWSLQFSSQISFAENTLCENNLLQPCEYQISENKSLAIPPNPSTSPTPSTPKTGRRAPPGVGEPAAPIACIWCKNETPEVMETSGVSFLHQMRIPAGAISVVFGGKGPRPPSWGGRGKVSGAMDLGPPL